MMRDAVSAPLDWIGIVRLGLAQAALGAVVVVSTTVLNRVMAVELALPAAVPGALIALHHGAEMLRPRWGYGSDSVGRRTPWIAGGMAVLALGGIGAAVATTLMGDHLPLGLALAAIGYVAIGLGAGAAGTSLLTLAATRVAPDRRAAAASLIWIMMILGYAVTAGLAGTLLDPFSASRLLWVVAAACGIAFALALAAIAGVEGAREAPVGGPVATARPSFRKAFRAVWAEPVSRRFTLFIFASMLACGAQDLVLDPFAGRVLGLTPGETTRLTGLQHGGAVMGMVAVAICGARWGRRHPGLLRALAVAGCVLSAAVLCGLAVAGAIGPEWPLRPSVTLLGFGNGAFAVAAIGAMMALAGAGAPAREGLRIGLWGAAQALAFALGSLLGPMLVQVVSALVGSASTAYAAAFLAEAALFLISARLMVSATASTADGREGGAALLAVRA